MPAPMPDDDLDLRFALATETGRRERNEDCARVHVGATGGPAAHGTVAVVADGLGGAKGGREAAEMAVHGFIDAYYALPSAQAVTRAAKRALQSVNRRIHAAGLANRDLAGMATTFSAVIFRGRQAHVLHVGDSRVWRLRGGRLERLTEDHNLAPMGLSNILLRCVGAEESVDIDHAVHDLAPGDRFLLTTDGVHDTLRDPRMRELLESREPDAAAGRLVEEALRAGSLDNVTAVVVDVVALPGLR